MASRFTGALMNMVTDFANINHSPDYNAKSKKKPRNPTINAMKKIDRRHSLNLAVGVSAEIPPFTPFTETKKHGKKEATTIEQARTKNRRQSAPVISNNTFENLHMKLSELKETSSLKEEIREESEKEESFYPPKPVLAQTVIADVIPPEDPSSKKLSPQSDTVKKQPERLSKAEGFDATQKAKIMYCNEQRASVVFIDDDITRPICGTGMRHKSSS